MANRSDRSITETTREVYELCCEPGARIKYQTLRLEKIDHRDGHDRWQVTRDGQYVDTINISAFHSAGQLQQWLDTAAEGTIGEGELFCESCPLGSLPSD